MSRSTSSNPSKVSIANQDHLRHQLAQEMLQCRDLTLTLFQDLDYTTFCQHIHPDFSPVGWHLGHIAYTEAKWLLQHCARQTPLFPEYHRLFAADGLPKADRVKLPSIPATLHYLETVRANVQEYLTIAPLAAEERLWRFLLQHESQHCETVAFLLALLVPPSANSQFPSSNSQSQSLIFIPAGPFEMGNESLDALDNERPIHQVFLKDYWIDRYPVTCREYRQFRAAGGYQTAEWWSPEGWQWLQVHRVDRPLHWSEEHAWDDHPVCGVSWYEADAYARFVGKRLPTEAEWEKAASWHPVLQQRQRYPWGNQVPDRTRCNHSHHYRGTTPVQAFPEGQSFYGCYDLLGNVWEWTASWFEGYAGFTHFPYPGYSQVYFDGQHRVLRGGSWVTRPWAMRSAFRNWYHPGTRELFAGFRCASDGPVGN
ncbi:MAG: SUMF1/EgtB/PvdO family nonheme iron enzyme [Leptolyngbyaceae cyanobacterium bins.59]|nr:SUMF1/EgtB/PvdO family nonheme iron enzyme [Leptolyngbyaceae cyanobacterium bins.59]